MFKYKFRVDIIKTITTTTTYFKRRVGITQALTSVTELGVIMQSKRFTGSISGQGTCVGCGFST